MFDHDYGYIYFLIPSIISFIVSAYVIAKILKISYSLKKQFHLFTFLIALLDMLQCFSWFLGPRYETSSNLCHGQEYIFQLAVLLKAATIVIVCVTIYYAIVCGLILDISSRQVMIWYFSMIIFWIISVSCNTAKLFCPFNYHHELSVEELNRNSFDFAPLISYVVTFLFPLTVCFIITSYFTIKSQLHAQKLAAHSINAVASSLRVYPVILAVCMYPISAFLIIVIVADKEIHSLLFISAILACSSGTVNGVLYMTLINKTPERRRSVHSPGTTLSDISTVLLPQPGDIFSTTESDYSEMGGSQSQSVQ